MNDLDDPSQCWDLAVVVWQEQKNPEQLKARPVSEVGTNMKEQHASISLLHASSEAEQQLTADCDKMIRPHDSSAA